MRDVGRLLLAGLVGVAAYNVWQWRRDKRRVDRRLQVPSMPPLSQRPAISALVAAWNERDDIDDHIRSFLELRYHDIQLILCAGGADGTLERATRYACERVIVLEQRAGDGKQRALARCLEQATGTIVYLTDADCRYSDEALLRLIAPLVLHGEQAATGALRPLDSQRDTLLPTYLDAVHVAPSIRRPRYVEGLQGANAAIWRHALDRSGGLGFAAPIGTDYQLAGRLRRAGINIRYVPESAVPTRYPETAGSYLRAQSRWLRNVLVHAPRRRGHRDLVAAARTIGIGAVMVAAPLPALIVGGIPLVMWTLLFGHALLSKLRYVFLAARLRGHRPPTRLLASLPVLTVLDFVAWAMPIVDVLGSKKRYQW